ncbi:MAG: hypothetical protein VYB50_04580 [Candidatus Thermoplasmatota archaeon]|nr:hypothetical protein [Candidatus Thermoplasmatota archaeon]
MTTKTGIAAQKAVLTHQLQEQLKSSMPEMKKPQVDLVLKFVSKYFGQEMHGQTDKAEFRTLVESISEKINNEGGSN